MSKRFFWIDLEMTGLNDLTDTILEVAIVITDTDFKTLEEYHTVVFQPAEQLAKMDAWCTKTHGDSGLTAAVPNGKPLDMVDQEVEALINRHYSAKDRIVLAGNSVGNDKRFIDRYMPRFAKRLHYRLIDVSSYKEIYREKYGISFPKKNAHRAVDDIYESIRELSFYLSYVNPTQSNPSNPVNANTESKIPQI